jgi:hypothetical protein
MCSESSGPGQERHSQARRAGPLRYRAPLPERAAEYLQTDADEPFSFDKSGRLVVNRRDSGKLVRSLDGEYVASEVENAHWSMARGLLHDIYPHPSADEFVQRWYRAFAAFFEESYLLGNAKYHLTRALEELPRDPMILSYAGAMHEAYASWGVQSIPMTRPGLTAALRLPSSQEEWSLAEPLLREAVKAGAPAEARLRHARVLGRLGCRNWSSTFTKAASSSVVDSISNSPEEPRPVSQGPH